jgi:hypothetical protein
MVGIGPEWVHKRELSITKNSFAGEFALDFMYWPGARHRLGWFVEPGLPSASISSTVLSPT